ncbi:DoxX family protein [uncultured Rothia sp.]|uniref:DoxX family protein n=1 Tax=uncultured Rothia sp. TaxID=316088 RepID=UPI0028DC0002|nr:DoxX family protein [uncultured Rothia sp.]
MNNDTMKSTGLLILRLVFGFVMIMHGTQKAFEWTPAGTTASFEQMGIPMAAAAAYFAMATELLGGIMIILGAGTRIAAAASVVSMSGALFFVHLAAGFSASKDGYEYVLTLAAVAASLALTGASKFSIDALITARRK